MADKREGFLSLASGGEVSAAPIDFVNCVDLLGGDRKFALGILKEFLEGLSCQVAAISAALAAGKAEDVRTRAHFIKGGAAVVSAHSLVAAATGLEEIGKSGDLAKGEAALLKLEGEVARLQGYCTGLTRGDC